jgi:hypothetical protein
MVFKKLKKAAGKLFLADRFLVHPYSKKIFDLNTGRLTTAKGNQGAVFDFEVYKGSHKANLVIKRYKTGLPQTKMAKLDFEILKKLNEAGYPIVPTFRLVKIGSEKYVAMTDLTKYGKYLGKFIRSIKSLRNDFGEKKIEDLEKDLRQMTKEIKERFDLDVWDSWEIVYDPKKNNLRAFILDVGMATKKHKNFWYKFMRSRSN